MAELDQPGRRFHVIVHIRINREDIVGGEAMFGTQVEKSLRGRVGERPACVWLEAVAREIPRLAESLDSSFGLGVWREEMEKTSMSLNGLRA